MFGVAKELQNEAVFIGSFSMDLLNCWELENICLELF